MQQRGQRAAVRVVLQQVLHQGERRSAPLLSVLLPVARLKQWQRRKDITLYMCQRGGRAHSRLMLAITPTHETDGSFNLGDFQAWRWWGWGGAQAMKQRFIFDFNCTVLKGCACLQGGGGQNECRKYTSIFWTGGCPLNLYCRAADNAGSSRDLQLNNLQQHIPSCRFPVHLSGNHMFNNSTSSFQYSYFVFLVSMDRINLWLLFFFTVKTQIIKHAHRQLACQTKTTK